MVEKHRHCIVCGVSVSAEKEPPLCSRKCEIEMEKQGKKQKYMRFLMILPIVILIAVFYLLPNLLAPK